MRTICLESHNIDNLFFGFGQFNYHLIKGFYNHQDILKALDVEITLISKHPEKLEKEFGQTFCYKKYNSLQRKKIFRIKKAYNLWHSLNQNTKIEPFKNIPYLLTVHDVNFMEELSGNDLNKRIRLFKDKLQRSHAITYISEYAKTMTHTYFKVPDIPEYVIYNGSSKPKEIPENHIPALLPKGDFIFTIGEVLEKKNFHTLVEMLANLPELNLIISGKNTTDYAKEIKKKVDKLQLENRVFLTGKISETDKAYYLKNCYAFCFPSLREGFGIPPIEAMQYGKPVFLSDKSSLPEVGGEHAFYWEHFEPKYMADILQNGMKIYNEDQIDYSEKLQQHANSYSWDNTAKQYLNVYRSLLK
ncbi:glycosyltransferase family 1 protein [Bizionia argentinensis JUB59]|uniref:Glycosyltransferase family 1 protein n=1 Tax=Bizionia argentinensis JUB59 TaxID=1046627 RepID=G2EF54_9FLAO|nr:glycosyltransferase family 1 protein [Bizionia argentinensis]EGV42947.1 glycosyltransferase family 1 protein [Bizionia argentinensis JUB59]